MRADTHPAVKTAVDSSDLAGLALFAHADLNKVAQLLEGCPIRALRNEEVLLAQGVTNRALHLVLKGRLRVHLDSVETEPVRLVKEGEAVGEISLVDERPTAAYVVADVATTVLTIDQQTFWDLVNASHAVARNMLLMVVERMRANNSLIAQGMQLRDQFRQQNELDPRTGLRNIKSFNDLLRRQLLRSSMGGKPTTVLMLDIDGFGSFNCEFGRAAGDQAIYAVARTLQEQLRPTDIVARVYGEKFAAILPECSEDGAAIVAERLREAISEAVVVMEDGSILPPVTVSIGIAEMQQAFDNADALLQAADAALARAKNCGRNTYSA
jgi:diguanylate cyclase (GGDEF)-like protein